MNGNENYYKILEVEAKADGETIKSSYRRLVRTYHPDFNSEPDAADRLKQINEAYRVLSDEKLRKQYDTLCALTFGLPIEKLKEKYGDPQKVRSIFQKVATGMAHAAGLFRKNKQKPGRDLRVYAKITFEQSFTGAQVPVEYMQPIACDECKGTGFSKIQPCEACNGQGRISSNAFPGIKKRCPRCNGEGWKGVEPCQSCEGSKRMERSVKHTVKIPAGVQHKQRLRIKDLGEGGHGFGGSGKPGDLIVVVEVSPHGFFKRDGNDLKVPFPMDFATAALGGRASVELPGGTITIEVPPLTWESRVFRIAGKGFPDPQSHKHGDCFLSTQLHPPENDHEKSVYSEYIQQINGPNIKPSPDLLSNLERIKKQ